MRKTIIRSILTLVISTAAMHAANAQLGFSKEYVEPPGFSVGFNIGLLDLWGDVGTKSPIDHYANDEYWKKTHYMGGIFVRYSASPALAMRLGVNYGMLYANDNWNYTKVKKAESIEDDAYQRFLRNQKVRANTWEGSFVFEVSPRRFNYQSKGAMKRFQPYLLFGVAAYHFRPQAEYITKSGANKGWVDLYDLHLEGDGFIKKPGVPDGAFEKAPQSYQLWQLAVPLGLGVKWDIGRQLGLGIEYEYRYCFTDYLDNVSDKYIDPSYYNYYLSAQNAALATEMQDRSWLIDPNAHHTPGEQRGNPSVKDAYSTLSITFYYKIKNRKSPWWY